MTRLAFVAVATFVAMSFAPGALAAGFGEPLLERSSDGPRVEAAGWLLARGTALHNLDLDRGLDPSGRPLYAVSARDPRAQTLGAASTRVRAGFAAISASGMFAAHTRLDLSESVADDSTRTGSGLVASHAWGVAALPVGAFTAGRTPSQWGLGLLANSGDAPDARHGDAADRLAFITPLGGLLWIAAADHAATSPFEEDSAHRSGFAPVRPSRAMTLAVLRWRDDTARERRRIAGKTSVEWGLLVSRRQEDPSVPARAFRSTAGDAWLRVTSPRLRVEAEAAAVEAIAVGPMPIPGVTLRDPVRSRQFGAALQTEARPRSNRFGIGLDAGVASGDPAPGFGVRPGSTPASRGDLDGAQTGPGDSRADNFRFHPDFHVDRILFREIVGTVTDAVYLRPHARVTLLQRGAERLELSLFAVASRAIFPQSTPSGRAPLGIEVDPAIAWRSAEGLSLSLEHAVLFPLAGLDNPAEGLDAMPAHLVRFQLQWGF